MLGSVGGWVRLRVCNALGRPTLHRSGCRRPTSLGSPRRLLLKKEKHFLFSCTCRFCKGISVVKLTPSYLPPESHHLHPIVTPRGEAAVRG